MSIARLADAVVELETGAVRTGASIHRTKKLSSGNPPPRGFAGIAKMRRLVSTQLPGTRAQIKECRTLTPPSGRYA